MARRVGGLQQQRSVRLWDPAASMTRFRRNCNAGHSTLHYLQLFGSRVASALLRPIQSFHAKAFSLLVYIEEQMPAHAFSLLEKTNLATFACAE
jgi:hypothetical protein